MKWCLPAFVLLATANFSLQAQKTYVIKPGERINEVLSFNQIYHYPSFADGTVIFHDGSNSKGKLNYNFVVAEIQFIDANGDTLSLANEKTIKEVIVSGDTYYYSDVYIKLISSEAGIRLGERSYFRDYIQKPGSYGLSTATTATNSVDVLVEPRTVRLNPDQEITLVKHTAYFFSGNDREFFPADKRNLPKAFPKYKKQINDYLSSNPLDFTKQEDLKKLVEFLGGLAK